MIRILQIMPSLSLNNGMMSVVINYHRNIDREKVQFDYLYFEENSANHIEEIHSLGGKTYCIGKPQITLAYLKRVKEFFNQHKGEYIAIHCHPIFASHIFANTAKRNGIKHVIAHSHSTRYSNKRLSAIRNYILSIFIGCFATDYMACSEEATRLFGRSIKDKSVYILRNAIDCNKFKYNIESREKTRISLGIQSENTILGHVGRFSSEKNHSFIIDVFNEYKKSNSNSKLLLVGDGMLLDDIKEKVKRLNLTQDVIFTGRREDISLIMSAMDVFIFPSIFEGVPVSVVEAQASGLKCFISNSITKEVGICNLRYLDLRDSERKWANNIRRSSMETKRRETCYKLVSEKGFDISKEAIKLQKYYIRL